MRVGSVAVIACALTAMAGQVLQGPAASAQGPAASAGSDKDRAADLAAIEKLHQQDIATTLSRDPGGVLKKLPDGSWRVFRLMGDTSQ